MSNPFTDESDGDIDYGKRRLREIDPSGKKFAPPSSAQSTTSRACASARAPQTSNVLHVPMPTTGTVSPELPHERCSIAVAGLER